MKPLLSPKEMDAVEDQFFTDDEGDLSKYRKRLPYLRSAWKKLCKNVGDPEWSLRK